MTTEETINEDLKVVPGMGATMSVGSDAYAYYVSELLPNGVIGLYEPESCWDAAHPWEGGDQTVQPFNPEAKSEMYIKRRYGKWWKVDRNGKRICRFTSKYERFRFGRAVSYRDPSF